jgi:hypothetical protein
MKALLTSIAVIAALTTPTVAANNTFTSAFSEYPIGWIYIPTAKMDDCYRGGYRCIITAEKVEVHSRPNGKSPVVTTFKPKTDAYVRIVDATPDHKWGFVMTACPIVNNGDGTLSFGRENHDGPCP